MIKNIKKISIAFLLQIITLHLVVLSASTVDSTFETGVLDNGITYYVKQNALPDNTLEFRLVFKAGSILETEAQRGLAHFCEHMAFNGTEHFEGNSVIKYLESVGVGFGSNLNASTGFDRTIYQFSLPVKDEAGIDSAYMIFSDWVRGLSFNHDDIDAERGVIMSEWRTSQGQQSRFKELVIPKLYYNSRYTERLPIGDTAVIKGFEYDEIKDFYKAWYRPDLTAIIVAGDIEKDLAVQKVKEWFADIALPDAPQERKYYDVPVQDSTFILRIADPEETATSISILLKEQSSSTYTDADVKEKLKGYLFNRIFNARLTELSKSATPPFLSASISSPNRITHSMSLKSVSIMPVERDYLTAISAFRRELDRVRTFGVLETELARTKEQIIKAQEKSLRNYDKRKSGTFVNDYIQNFLFEDPINDPQAILTQYERLLSEISAPDLISEIDSWYASNNRVILIETPQKYEAEMPSDVALLASIDSASKLPLKAYEELDYSKPFFTDHLAKATIVDSSYDASLDLTQWTLSNGVKVLLKPTDYSTNHIQFRAFSPGGYSLLSDDDFFAASKLHSYYSGTGYGEFSKPMLRKKFSDKSAKVVAAVNEYNEGMVGNSDHESFELSMQYAYMQFVHPREDSLVFNSFKTRLLTSYQDAHLKPSYVFSDTLIKTLYQHNPRKFVIPPMEWVHNMSVEQMQRIHSERFADASDFTFVFAGDFELDSVRPNIVKYLGNLPNINRKEDPIPNKAKALKAPNEFVFPLGHSDNVSKVMMRYTGTSTGDNFEQSKVTCAAAILNMRLLDVLREKEGDVYSVSVKGAVGSIPKPLFSGNIYFTCDPSKVDKLVAMTEDIIKTLAKEGPTAVELENVKKIEIEKLRKYQESNLFWVRSLKTYLENDWSLQEITSGESHIEAIRPRDVEKVMRKYFKAPNTFILAPESQD